MSRKDEIDHLNQEIDNLLRNGTHRQNGPDAERTDLPRRLAQTDFSRRSTHKESLRKRLLSHHLASDPRRFSMKHFSPLFRAASFGAVLIFLAIALGWMLSNAGLAPSPAAEISTAKPEREAATETPLRPPESAGTVDFSPLQAPLTFEWTSGPNENFFYAEITANETSLGQIDFGFIQGGWCDRSANGGLIAFVHQVTDNVSAFDLATANATLRWASLHDLAQIQDPFPEIQVTSPPAFSSNGFRLAFSGCPPDEKCGLFIYDLETGTLDRISPYQPGQPVLWSPDGTEIAFEIPSGDLTELHVVSADDGATRYIGSPADPGSPLSSWGRRLPAAVSGTERCEAAPGADLPQPLSMASTSEEIRLRLLYSHTFWHSLWADAELTDTSGASTSSQRTQIWLAQPARARVLSGPPDGAPAFFWISDGEQTRTGEPVRVEPFHPPREEGNSVYPHPMTGILPTPLSSLIFPAGLAQRGGTYVPVEMAVLARRDTLVVDWQASSGEVVDRFWVDVVTGVILRQQNRGKDGGAAITSDYTINAITFEPNLQPAVFLIDAPFPPAFAEGPQDTYAEAPTPTPATPPDTSPAYGEIYLQLESPAGFSTAGLVHFPAACLVAGATCPPPETVEGAPAGFAYAPPPAWSADRNLLVYPISGAEDAVWTYNRTSEAWARMDGPYFGGAVWSPDGAWLAGQPAIFGSADRSPIVLVRPDGSERQEVLGEAPGFKTPIGWVDGRRLLFVNALDNETSDEDPYVYAEVQLYDMQTGEVTVLVGEQTDANQSLLGLPDLAPDRSKFLYQISDLGAGTSRVFVVEIDSGAKSSFDLDAPGSLSWAPDSEQMLLSAALGYSCSVSLVQAEGEQITRLYDGDWGGNCNAVWSPDGAYLVIPLNPLSPTMPRLAVVDIETGAVQVVELPDAGVAFERAQAVWLP